MANQALVNRILKGKDGTMWFNGVELSTLIKIDTKVKGKFEDVNLCNDQATYQAYSGWSGEGTFSCKKIDSTVLQVVADAYNTGIMPDIKIITKLTDVSTGKSERVCLEGVVITEFAFASFEASKLLDEEFPFKFSKFELLETI
jgi:hypothetical protein